MNTTNLDKTKLIALYGGTFDPIHLGHVNTAEQTAHWLNLDSITLIPAHIPPHKSATHATAEQRKAMVALVCDENKLFTLDDRELNRQTPSFTLDTLAEIKSEQPNAQLCFIMGMDSLLSFTKWHRWQDILNLCHLVINIRPGYPHQALKAQLPPELHSNLVEDLSQMKLAAAGKIILHQCKSYHISSTQIRNTVHSEQNTQQLVPLSVYQYIKQQQLYR